MTPPGACDGAFGGRLEHFREQHELVAFRPAEVILVEVRRRDRFCFFPFHFFAQQSLLGREEDLRPVRRCALEGRILRRFFLLQGVPSDLDGREMGTVSKYSPFPSSLHEADGPTQRTRA